MILILTNERDLTTDFVVRELKRRGRDHFRLNTNAIADMSFTLDPVSMAFAVSSGGRLVQLDQVRAAYFRRPELPDLKKLDHDDGQRAYASTEWSALLKSLYLLIGSRWLSHPRDILIAEDKPSQIHLAKRLGFNVPDTVITNDLDAARALFVQGSVVGKPHRQAVVEIEGAEHVMFTSRIEALTEEDRESLQYAPIIFQRLIPKQFDIRVTVVGEQVFPVAIYSQEYDESSLDWRRGSNPNIRHEVITLPGDIQTACTELVRQQKLRFGAIDLVLGEDGKFWFLECNPNGQWAWIENRTGLSIAAAIVDELERIAAE
jgi:glutathione synthase/RimK-type ligase-like ATP-grasp enzyme